MLALPVVTTEEAGEGIHRAERERSRATIIARTRGALLETAGPLPLAIVVASDPFYMLWGMKTRGTNPGTMTDDALRACIADAARDVAEAAERNGASCYEIHFALGTLQRLTHELRLRCVENVSASEHAAMIPA